MAVEYSARARALASVEEVVKIQMGGWVMNQESTVVGGSGSRRDERKRDDIIL